MIATIRGEVISKGKNSLVIDLGGLGIQVFIPAPLLSGIKEKYPIVLFTYLVVREDNLSLYGFEKPEERDLFTNLIKVNGIGPRIALSMISTLPVSTIYQAIVQEKPEVFQRVPGIGNKSAQKIILTLHDKLKMELSDSELIDIQATGIELLDALTALGYSVVEAQAAIQSLPKDAPDDIEERLRLALQYFSNL